MALPSTHRNVCFTRAMTVSIKIVRFGRTPNTKKFIKEISLSLSKRFNKLPPKTEYLVAVKSALEEAGELGLRDISRRVGLSPTQSFSALGLLTSSGEVALRRQTQSPAVLYRLVNRSP